MKKTTFRETDLQEKYIDDWMKQQARLIIRGKQKEVKRSDFFHEAINLHSKFNLQSDMAKVFEAEFNRLHDLINQFKEENEHLKFKMKAQGESS